MQLLHIDRHGYMKPGQTIEFIQSANYDPYLTQMCKKQYESGFSFTGLTSLLSSDVFDFNNPVRMRKIIFEIVFEHIRQRYFKERPSRFQSFFACAENDLQKWQDLFQEQENVKYPVYLIEVENPFKADAIYISDMVYGLPNICTDKQELSIAQIAYQATFYWNGKKTGNPTFEYLITPPFRVIEEYHSSIS